MTGRYAIRSGNGSVPIGEGVYGLVQWEVTMAEMLSEAGYSTAMFASPPCRPMDPDGQHFYFLRNSGDSARVDVSAGPWESVWTRHSDSRAGCWLF